MLSILALTLSRTSVNSFLGSISREMVPLPRRARDTASLISGTSLKVVYTGGSESGFTDGIEVLSKDHLQELLDDQLSAADLVIVSKNDLLDVSISPHQGGHSMSFWREELGKVLVKSHRY